MPSLFRSSFWLPETDQKGRGNSLWNISLPGVESIQQIGTNNRPNCTRISVVRTEKEDLATLSRSKADQRKKEKSRLLLDSAQAADKMYSRKQEGISQPGLRPPFLLNVINKCPQFRPHRLDVLLPHAYIQHSQHRRPPKGRLIFLLSCSRMLMILYPIFDT